MVSHSLLRVQRECVCVCVCVHRGTLHVCAHTGVRCMCVRAQGNVACVCAQGCVVVLRCTDVSKHINAMCGNVSVCVWWGGMLWYLVPACV